MKTRKNRSLVALNNRMVEAYYNLIAAGKEEKAWQMRGAWLTWAQRRASR